jgi:2-polyprenyl-3-methyl-5-hydroxy-6-metoxy-1,4-benzoquinol methylase
MIDSGYYSNAREEVAALVPDEALTILDVGCGRGILGALLKTRVARRRVIGLEIQPDVAEEAKRVLDEVIVGDLQQIDLPFAHALFDCVVFADVLEHMIDPAAALRKIRPFLKADAVIVCSIPNIRHYTTFLRLATRGWEYTDYGLFDRTHLRFFSLRSMQQMFSDAGYIIVRKQPNIVASKKMKLLNTLCFGGLDDFLAQQYLLIAQALSSAHG